MRVFRVISLSPVYQLGTAIANILSVKPKFTDEAPKRFALFIGLLFSVMLSVFYTLGYIKVGEGVSFVLLICALLEGFFDYCVGCKIYQLLKFFRRNPNGRF